MSEPFANVTSARTPVAVDPMLPRQFRIDDVTVELSHGSVFTWTLHPVDGQPLAFQPGQFTMLYQFGVGEVPVSISGDAEAPGLVHTVRAVGAVTRLMQQLGVGDVVGVRGPFGSAWPVAEAEGKNLILVAGGIGLAPLRPVIYHVLRHRERFGRLTVLYGTREPTDILYRKEIKAWRQAGVDFQVTVDRGGRHWRGNIGVVTTLIERGGFDGHHTVAMLCGPELMIRFAALALERRGVAPERTYVSLERNMKCGIGHCGHCQYGPHFMCRDGPVFRMDRIAPLFRITEF